MMELPDETLRVVREVVELFSLLDSSYRQSELITKEELVQLNEFLQLIVPFWRTEASFADRLNASAEHITRYISRDHKIVAGTTYDAVWHLVKRLSNCGLFSTIGTASQIRQNNNESPLPDLQDDHEEDWRQMPVKLEPYDVAVESESGGKCMIFNGETDSRKLPEIQDGGNVSDIPVCSTVQSRHSFSWQRASKKFCCSVCMKTFFTARCLRHHVTFQHLSRKMLPVAVAKEFIRSIPRRPFDQLRYCVRCIYCRELFASRKYLQMHQTCCVKSSASLGYQQRKSFQTNGRRLSMELLRSTVGRESSFGKLARRSTRQHRQGSLPDDQPRPVRSSTSQLYVTYTTSIVQSYEGQRSQKVYVCMLCHKQFLSCASVIRHGRLHTGERPFVCRHCGKAFFDKSNCRKHELRHVPFSQRPTCTRCNERFLSNCCLSRHVNGGHENRRCPLCGARHAQCASTSAGSFDRSDDGDHAPRSSALSDGGYFAGIDRATGKASGDRQGAAVGERAASPMKGECEDAAVAVAENRGLSRLGSRARGNNRRQLKPRNSETRGGSSSRSLSSMTNHNLAEATWVANSKVQCEAADLTPTTKHRCPECGKCLATKSNLERHYRLHIGDRPFECETCGREFSDMSNLRKHEQVHGVKQATANDATSDPIADSPGAAAAMDDCSDDGSLLNPTHVGKSALQETSDSGAETTGKKSKGQPAEFPCQICNKIFPYRSHLYEHVKVHTNDRPYQCEVCGKAFKRTGDLTTHARFHDAEKQFECTDCGQRFRWKNGLDRHRRIHTGERPFLCTVCGRAFADWGSHKQHVRSHMLLVAGIQPERFPCKVCGKTFAWKRGLARHARSHAAGKGF